MPNVPLNVRVDRVQLSAPCRLSVNWDVPDNNNKFDLEHFKIHIMLPEQETHIANGTSMEPEYHFHSDNVMILPQNSMHVTVTAVSSCSQEGLKALAVELGWREVTDKAMFTNVSDAVSKTENDPKEYEHVMNGNEV